MIHPWVVSRKFLLMQPKMTCWNLFLMRFISWFMTPSGFSWFVSRINTWGFNQEILLGFIWWFFNQDFVWIIFCFFLRWLWTSFQPRLFWFCLEFLLGFFGLSWGLNQWINSRPFLETSTRLIVSVFSILVKHPGFNQGTNTEPFFSNLYKVIYKIQNLHMRKSVIE